MTIENMHLDRDDVLARLGLPANPATGSRPPIPDRSDGGAPCGEERLGIVIRPGPTGRRAALADGSDVWEVVGAVHAVCAEDPGLRGDALYGVLAEVTGLDRPRLGVAVRYYAAHPAEIEDRIAANAETAARLRR